MIIKTGKVISDKMNKSRIVAIESSIRHPLYQKTYKKTSKIMAHDEKNISKDGDVVEISPTRSMSQNKAWKVIKIIN